MNIDFRQTSSPSYIEIKRSDFIDLLEFKLRALEDAKANPDDDWDYQPQIDELIEQIAMMFNVA